MTNQAIAWVQFAEGADARQAVLHVLRAGRDARAAPRAEGVDREVQGQVRPGLGQAARRDARPPEEAGRRAARTPSSRPSPRPSRTGTRSRADEKKLFARQMEIYAGFGEYADYRDRPAGRRPSRRLGELDNTLVIYIVGDNGASAEGGMNGMFNEMTYFNGVPESVADMLKHFDELGGPTTYRALCRRLGGRRRHAVSAGPSRWPRTSAAPATAWSSAGRSASRPRASCARSSTTSSTSRRRSSRRPDCPSRRSSTASRRSRSKACSMVYTFDDAKARDRHTTQYFEIVRQPRHLSRRLVRGDRAPRAVGAEAARCARRRQVGAVRRRTRLQPGQRPRRARTRPSSRSCRPLFLNEAAKYQVLPIDDRGDRTHRMPQRRRPARPDGWPHLADRCTRA